MNYPVYYICILYNTFDVSHLPVVMFPCRIRAEAKETDELKVYNTSLADGSTQTDEIIARFAQKINCRLRAWTFWNPVIWRR